MNKRYLITLGLLIVITSVFATSENYTIENKSISRTISTDGNFRTVKIVNKLLGKTQKPTNDIEFKLRISDGTHIEGSDIILTSKDFSFDRVLKNEESELGFLLSNKEHGLKVEVFYEFRVTE